MTPTNTILNSLSSLLANDTASLANPAALHVHLIAAPFTPGPGLAVAGLTFATFAGGGPKNAGIGPQQNFVNPVNGLRTVQILEPSGGWTWIASATPATPESIYGYAVTDNADTIVYASERFSSPIVVSEIGQGLSIPNLRLSLSNSAIS